MARLKRRKGRRPCQRPRRAQMARGGVLMRYVCRSCARFQLVNEFVVSRRRFTVLRRPKRQPIAPGGPLEPYREDFCGGCGSFHWMQRPPKGYLAVSDGNYADAGLKMQISCILGANWLQIRRILGRAQ